MDRIFQLSDHALSRMAARNVSRMKVAETLFHGQIFSVGGGVYKAKLKELHGKTVDKYVVVFSKKENRIITVEHNMFRIEQNDPEDLALSKGKIYKRRKQILREQELDSWCREQYTLYHLHFTA